MGRYGRNAMVQGAAAELFKRWAVTRAGPARRPASGAEIVLCLHDELLVHTPAPRVREVARIVDGCLQEAAAGWAPDEAVRFVAAVSVGRSVVRRQVLMPPRRSRLDDRRPPPPPLGAPDEAVHDGASCAPTPAASTASTATVFVECASGYRTDGPEAFRPVGETEFVVAADPGRLRRRHRRLRRPRPGPRSPTSSPPTSRPGEGRFRGIRHANAWDASPDIRESHTNPPPDLLGQDDFRRGFAALGAAGLSFDAWMYHPQLPELVDLCRARARRARRARPPRRSARHRARTPGGATRCWRRGGTSMADVAGVRATSCSSSAGSAWRSTAWAGTAAGGATPEQLVEAWGEPIRWCIETFGAGPLHVRVELPGRQACRARYADLWAAFELIVADFSAAERGGAVRRHRPAGLPAGALSPDPGCEDASWTSGC